MTRNLEFTEGEIYHVYDRGVDKRTIFQEEADYDRFMKLMHLSNSSRPYVTRDLSLENIFKDRGDERIVHIGAYCLMPNHFHLVVSPRVEGGLSKFMLKIKTAYSMYFNDKNERTGALFESRFKARYVDDDRYLKHLITYVHLNPLSFTDPKWKERGVHSPASASQSLLAYKYSSLKDWIGEASTAQSPISRDYFADYFERPSLDIISDTKSWLESLSTEGSPLW